MQPVLLVQVANQFLGQACFTLATAFTATYAQFVWAQIFTRVFGYAEEMLCFVVISEEVAARARGWATGTISALDYVGAGLASLAFAAVTLLPYGWRALYVIGAVPRPPGWSGWRIAPVRMEFWHDRPFRLHDRIEFRRDAPEGAWTKVRMYP